MYCSFLAVAFSWSMKLWVASKCFWPSSSPRIYLSIYIFRTAVLRRLFYIKLSCKHCNFSRGCLLARWHSKPWQGLLFLACVGGVRKGGERNLGAREFPTIFLITHGVQAKLFFLFGAREQADRRAKLRKSKRQEIIRYILKPVNGQRKMRVNIKTDKS